MMVPSANGHVSAWLARGDSAKGLGTVAANLAEIIDESQIGGLAEAAGIEAVRSILEAFWESTADLQAELNSAVQNASYQDIVRIGHTLKGSAANIGASTMATSAKEIEQAARAEAISEVRDALEEFGQTIEQTRKAIDDILQLYS